MPGIGDHDGRIPHFPAYAPEINPDELVWQHLKTQLANAGPDSVDELMDDLIRETRRLRRLPELLRGFVVGAELPHFFSP